MPLTPSPWWHKDRHADRRPFLVGRDRIKTAIRAWFAAEGFIEVEPALLQVSPGNETHLHAFATDLVRPDLSSERLYLSTSPEFAMKKLLAAGERKIFAFAPAHRNRERGALHHPAFTMLEWYRAEEPYATLLDDCQALLRCAADATGLETFSWRGRSIDPYAPFHHLTLAEAFRDHARVDLLATLSMADADRDKLAGFALAQGYRFGAEDTWGDIFSRILVETIEPVVGNGVATALLEYPSVMAALARPTTGDARVAERFEVYACGIELVNAFGELTDPDMQRQNLRAEMDERARIYGERYPIDEDFIAALAHMPQASGAAMGFDRLVMLATGATHIEQVLWTPLP